ncbi:MAG: phosphodiesterase [Alphaproteobacteria bacterium]
MKLIQVSDLHFVPPGTLLLGLDPRARLEAAIADINQNHGDAALCLFTGDLADHGAPDAYDALAETLAALQLPWRLTIGNHDDRAAFLRAFPEAPHDENGFIQSVVSTDAGPVILLDTHEPGQGSGSFCARRQAWLQAQLKAAAGEPAYLFMHHPPLDIGIPSLDVIGLVDKQGFADAVAGANIRHIFFGHVHRPISGSWGGIPYSALCSLVHQVPLDFVTKSPVPYDHAPPAYNVILLNDADTVVHHHNFLDASRLAPGQERYTKAP